MIGGEASPFLVLLTTASPRTRFLSPLALSATYDNGQEAWDDVRSVIDTDRAGDEDIVESLDASRPARGQKCLISGLITNANST